jgi:hypothetical protein
MNNPNVLNFINKTLSSTLRFDDRKILPLIRKNVKDYRKLNVFLFEI